MTGTARLRPMRLLLLAACCVLAVACGPGGAGVPALPEAPTPEGATVFTARDDLVDPHPIPIQSWTRVDGDRIAVHFETGTPECFGVDATVTESGTTVTVALRGGTLPEAVDRACIMIAVAGVLELTLRAPLADRIVTAG